MKIMRMSAAVILAVSMMAMSGCHREESGGGTDFVHGSGSSSERTAQGDFTFRTVDMDGREVTFDDYRESKVIMFNMWEPWCGPCCGELPELQRLYEKYSPMGLTIVGVYSDADGLRDVVEECGVRYPIIRSCSVFEGFETGYVPTTFFVDGSGNVLSEEPYIGAKSYGDWEKIILSYLK